MFQKILKVLGKRLWWNRLLENNINFYFKTKRFTFRQKHVSGLIQRRLDYFYISNSMQVSVKNTDVLASLLTDYLRITFSCFKNEESNRGRGFWKFNNSLIENVEYVLQMKKNFLDTLNEVFIENILDDQVK